MAQRTGAKRFLASPAKSASARVILALALAALVLAGCGGGSSAEDSTEAGSTTADAASQSAAATTQGGSDAKQGPGAKQATQPGSAEGSQGKGGGAGQKQGQRIAQPKGPRAKAPTPAQIATATVADMTLQSPAIPAGSAAGPGALPAPYTCDGKDSWPAFSWSGVPSDTAELILYAMSVQPVEGKLFVDWAVAGLDPGLTQIESGELPKGAIVGTNSFGKRGYSICPAGAGEIYMFAIYALPRALNPPKGFDARELRKTILDVSGNVGLLPALYAR